MLAQTPITHSINIFTENDINRKPKRIQKLIRSIDITLNRGHVKLYFQEPINAMQLKRILNERFKPIGLTVAYPFCWGLMKDLLTLKWIVVAQTMTMKDRKGERQTYSLYQDSELFEAQKVTDKADKLKDKIEAVKKAVAPMLLVK